MVHCMSISGHRFNVHNDLLFYDNLVVQLTRIFSKQNTHLNANEFVNSFQAKQISLDFKVSSNNLKEFIERII